MPEQNLEAALQLGSMLQLARARTLTLSRRKLRVEVAGIDEDVSEMERPEDVLAPDEMLLLIPRHQRLGGVDGRWRMRLGAAFLDPVFKERASASCRGVG